MSYDKEARQDANELGKEYEEKAWKLLKEQGHRVELMPYKHPYDLLVDGVVKVDVKVGNLRAAEKCGNRYSFHIGKKPSTCDAFILYGINEGEEKRFFIPSLVLGDIADVSIGEIDSEYNKYIDDISLIKRLYYGVLSATG